MLTSVREIAISDSLPDLTALVAGSAVSDVSISPAGLFHQQVSF